MQIFDLLGSEKLVTVVGLEVGKIRLNHLIELKSNNLWDLKVLVQLSSS